LNTSFYQDSKPFIIALVGLSKDSIHIHLGVISLVLTVLVTKKSLCDWKILIPGLSLSVVMELLDLKHDLTYGKLFPAAYIHDLVNTNIIPITFVTLSILGVLKTRKSD